MHSYCTKFVKIVWRFPTGVCSFDTIRSEAEPYDVSPFRTGRQGGPGGGVIIYVRDTLFCKRRPDLKIQGLESTWVDLIKESVDRAYNSNTADIIIIGDFNIYLSKSNNNKMIDLLLEYNLKQIITEPTHFTENSSSLIDLTLVRNNNNVLTSSVADPFMANYTRYHCPVIR